jgi:hypothetical protein
MEMKLKRGESNGFTKYSGVIDGIEVSITNFNSRAGKNKKSKLLRPFCIHMKGLPYQYGGYCYFTLTEAREALSELLKEAGKGANNDD